MKRLALVAVLAASAPSIAVAQTQLVPDYFPNAKKGRLFVTVELTGSGRKDLSNKVEWYRLTAARKLELEIAMMMPGETAVPNVRVGGFDQNNPPASAEQEAMQKALDACNGDRSCQRSAMMKIGSQMQANPAAFQVDYTRFENWMADRRVVCAKGVATVDDTGDGVNISPPAPSRPYKFARTGRLELPADASGVMQKACDVELSVDRKTGLASLRLSDPTLAVPVKFTGDTFGVQPSVPFIEGAKKLEVLDQGGDAAAGLWEGKVALEKVGVASHNSGSTVAPLSGTLTWRFQRN